MSGDSTILLDEVVIARKARKPFRDKLMGRLDSLAQMNLNSVYVCTSCGLLLNYNPDYQGHHALVGEGGCPAKGRKQPVDGETYRIAKYKYYGDAKGGESILVWSMHILWFIMLLNLPKRNCSV